MMDGKGNINVNAPNTISMNATDIIMTASKNITSSAGMNISESAGQNKNLTTGENHILKIHVNENNTSIKLILDRQEIEIEGVRMYSHSEIRYQQSYKE